MIRNLSPRQISLFWAIIFSLIFAVLLFFSGSTWLYLSISSISFGIICFLVTLISIQVFIYRKIKLIYKSIHQLKTKGTQKDQIDIWSSSDPLQKVNEDVKKWAKDQSNLISGLQNQETFRKEFLANVSHELKTPIFSIKGYIHTLLDGALEDETVNRKFLENAARNADRLQILVEELMAINKLENGDYAIEPSKFDIWSLCKEVLEQVEILAKQKNIHFHFKEGCNKPFYVIADKEGIRQVFTNLLSNSIKYGKENGETTISFYLMGNNLLTEITDNGEGIKQEDLPRLFERFYRVEKSRSREMGGTGLGLSIVKHILEAHEQTINVRSTVGIGSTFGFTLNLA